MASNPPSSTSLPPLSKLLKRQKVKLLAFDFDLTLLTIHTSGRHRGPPASLQPSLRPTLLPYLRAAASSTRLLTSVVTSSSQVPLIKSLLSLTLGPRLASKVTVKGRDDKWSVPLMHALPEPWRPALRWKLSPKNKKKQGKIDHFLSLAYEHSLGEGGGYEPSEVLYFDDDPLCVLAARSNSIVAFQVGQGWEAGGGARDLGGWIEGGGMPGVSEAKSKSCSVM